MAWLRLDETFADHYKPRRLAKRLGTSRAEARGWVARLWAWTATNAKDGNLAGYDADDIAHACDLEREDISPEEFCTALLEVGLIDKNTDNELSVHDWMEYAEGFKAAERKAKYRAGKKRERVSQDSLVTVPSDQTRQDQTGQDRTKTLCRSKKRSKDPSRPVGEKYAKRVAEVYSHWRQYHPRAAPKLYSDTKEYNLIKSTLQAGTSVDDCKEAIDGYHRSPFHQGLNDRNHKYLNLTLIFRDNDHVAKGIEMASDDVLVSLKSEKQLREGLRIEKWIREGTTDPVIADCYERKKLTDGSI